MTEGHRGPASPRRDAAAGARFARWIAAALLVLLAVQALSSMVQKSVTVDEITYLTAGAYHLRTGDFHYNQTNPPLMKLVAGLPLLALGLDLPARDGDVRRWTQVEQWRFARDFLYDNRRDADTILLIARLPSVAISLLLGCLVYGWSRRLYGEWGGLLSLGLYCLSPNILAHSRLATQDIGLAAAVFACTYCFWRSTRGGRPAAIVLFGLTLGLGLLIKTPAAFSLAAFGSYGLWCVVRNEAPPLPERMPLLRHMAGRAGPWGRAVSLLFILSVGGVVALFVVNAGYGFQGTLAPLREQLPLLFEPEQEAGSVLRQTLGSLRVPLPSAFVEGLHFQTTLQAVSGSVYFAGRIHESGLWYLTLAALLLKVPLPVLALFGAALWQRARSGGALEAERLLLLVIGAYLLAFTWMGQMGGLVRYVLPIFPCALVIIGRLLAPGRLAGRPARAAVAVAVAWTAAASWSIHPHYLAYFNELIGGSDNGYRYLADSNLDWGQDLGGLKIWMEENDIERIQLAYFGSADAEHYGIDYDYLPSVGLAPRKPGEYWWYELDSPEKRRLRRPTGLVAVSVNLLTGPQWIRGRFGGMYDWLQEHEPIDQVGHSILIYRIEE